MARAAARRRIWRAPRSASVVRPGQAAAFGKQRATTDRSRSTTSMSDPPMYEATALMPIRASVLRRPASNADGKPGDGLGRAERLGAARAGQLRGELDGEPRLDRGRTDGEGHGHRVDVEDVDGADGQVGPSAQARRGQRGVDGAGRQDRRDRQALERPGGIGQDEELGAAARRGSRPRRRDDPAPRPDRQGPSPGPRSHRACGRTTGRRRLAPRRAARRGRPRSAGPGGPSVGRAVGRRGAPAAGRARPAGPSRSVRVRGRWPGSSPGRTPGGDGRRPAGRADRGRASACRRPCSTAARGLRAPSS